MEGQGQRGKKHNDDIKEKALALLAVNNNVQDVANQLGLKYSTVKTWEKKALKSSEEGEEESDLAKLRNKKKEEFVEKAWNIIEKANQLMERKIDRALTKEQELDAALEELGNQTNWNNKKDKETYFRVARKIDALKMENISQLSTIIGTLYDKQALISREATVNHGIDSSLEEKLKQLSGDEM